MAGLTIASNSTYTSIAMLPPSEWVWISFEPALPPDSPKTTAMANAVAAIHRQHKADGRPFKFEPFRVA